MIDRSRLKAPALSVETVLDSVEDGCLLFDQRLECVYANESGSALFGLAPHHLIGRNLSSAFPSAVASELQRAATSVLASRKSSRVHVRDASSERWLEARMHPSSDGLLAIVSDITAEKRKELELAAHTEYLQQLVDQIPAFLWVIDRDLVVRRIEGGRPMMEALDRDRLIGVPMCEVTGMGSSAEDVALSVDMHRRVLQGTPEQYRATWKGITLEARIRPLRDREGGVVGIVGVGIDVTEQTRMQEQLRASEERFRALIERSTDLIAILGDDGRFSYASPSHEEVLGIEASHLQAIDPFSVVHPHDVGYLREQIAALQPGQNARIPRPIRVRTRTGEERSLAVALTNLRRSPAVRGVVLNSRDVTKELALEGQLRQSQKLEALGQLAGGVAHDFNNVLAAIDGFAQILREDLAADDPRRRDVEQILKAAERGARITRQLLAFARYQLPATTRIDLVELVHELSRMLRALLPATITLRVSPEPGEARVEVQADRSQIEQVIINLTVNARDAMPAGGMLSIEVRSGATPDTAHTATLEVRDTGVGMSPEVQTRAFEPFFTTKEPGRGTGLGLATVYGIVRQHSGSIDIASSVGEGTRITVRLPMAAPGAERAAVQSQAVARDHHGRVLVVEDEEQVRDVTASILQRAGYEVVAASDAQAALEFLRSTQSFDLVLTDSTMPGMRGEDLAAEIGRVRPGLPVILMSGYIDLDRPATTTAVAAFIQKPFTLQGLLTEVRRAIKGE